MKQPLLLNLLFADGRRFVANQRGAFALAGDGGGDDLALARMEVSPDRLFEGAKRGIAKAQCDAVNVVAQGTRYTLVTPPNDGRSLAIIYHLTFIKRVTRESYRQHGQTQHGKELGRV